MYIHIHTHTHTFMSVHYIQAIELSEAIWNTGVVWYRAFKTLLWLSYPATVAPAELSIHGDNTDEK
jgi:hypothetical protein